MLARSPSLGPAELVRDPLARRILLSLVAVSLANQLCGINALITYTDTILATAGAPLRPELAGLAVALLMLLGTLLSAPLIARVDRRPLLASSLGICGIGLALLGAHMWLAPGPSLVPLLCLVICLLSFSLGMGPLCFVLLSDFSLPRLATTAGTVTGVAAWTTAGLTTLAFPALQSALGPAPVYGGFAACAAVGAALALWLPETRGRSIRQVEDSVARALGILHTDIGHTSLSSHS
jgi:MFS family permease